MKKRISLLMLASLLFLFFTMSAFASDAMIHTDIKIMIDGQEEAHGDALMMNNQVFLPLRAFVAKLGVQPKHSSIVWDAINKSVTFHKADTKIMIQVDSKEAFVGDEPISLSAAPILKNGRTYISVGVIEQILDKKATWDASTKTVLITTSNKDKAIAVLKSFETGETTALEKWISPDQYIQHNLAFPSGREVVIEAIGQLKGLDVTYDIKRVIEDGDYVAVHSLVNLFGESVVFDIFRFENGLIVEHWDNVQELAPLNPSGRSMIDGATEIMDIDKTKENKALVEQFFRDIFMGENPEAFLSYYDGDNYIQHNPLFGDGVSGLMEVFQQPAEPGLDSSYTIHMVIGEGNFVLVVGEGTFNGVSTAIYDLLRVENGKLAEHWDVIETIPPQDEWQNENGKF